MLFRTFIALIGLICVYLVYDATNIVWAKSYAYNADKNEILSVENADLTIVEYLDYSCTHCQDLHPLLTRSLKQDGKVNYIIRPIISGQNENGTKAAQLVYAAGQQDRFFEAHKILIENFRIIDDAYIDGLALQIGLNAAKLREDMQSQATQDRLQENTNSLRKFKVKTIPAILAGDRVMYEVRENLPDSQELLNLFTYARAL